MKRNSYFLKTVLLLVFTLLLQGVAMAQTKKVSGVVKDDLNEPLLGVLVQIKGTAVGTITDENGAFTLEVPAGTTSLTFSMMGMSTQEVAITGDVVNVTLKEDSKDLDEVVVVGYGTVKKRDLTGAVSSLKSSDLQSVASNNAMEAMQGKIAGMDISKSSGAAGSGLDITLRGNRSISASNNPLIIVDGVEYGSTIDINSSDIESMEVLKDGASTAIYGTRGANGVIIITTKKGKAGGDSPKSSITYSHFTSFNSPTKVPKTMSVDQDINLLIERQRYTADVANGNNWGSTPLSNYTPYSVLSLNDSTLYANGVSVDWFDLVLDNTLTQNHELSLVGGTSKTSYNMSLGYLDEKGLMVNDDLKRYNVKFGVEHQIVKGLKLGANMLYTRRDWNRREDGVWSQVLKMHSLADTALDIPSPTIAPQHSNPLINQRENYYVNKTSSDRIFANSHLLWTPTKGLNLKTMFASDLNSSFKGVYEDYQIASRYQSSPYSYMSQENKNSYSITWDNTIDYDFTIKKDHNLTTLLGSSMNVYNSVYEKNSGTAGSVHYFSTTYYDMSKVSTPNSPVNEYVESSMLSYFGRLNYKFKQRYIFSATLRSDGSSVLSEGNKWGYFPSAAIAWRISDERFLKNKKNVVNNLKVRYSWGVSGNAAIDPYGTLALLSQNRNYYCFDNVTTFGFVPGNLGNKDLTWETTETHNLGIDFAIIKDRISGTVDVYYSQTSDLLLLKSIPPSSGFPSTWENVGATENRGIEVVLTTVNVDSKKFRWTSDWTFSLNRDKVVSLASGLEQDFSDVDRALQVGKPVSCFLDYETSGVFGINDPDLAYFNAKASTPYIPGMLKIVDQNGDSIIDANDRILYNQSPKFIFGWNNTFTYKNFTLNVITFARVGQWIAYDLYDQYRPTQQDGSADLDYWTPENQGARFPRPNITESPYRTALNKVEASYIKIKDITLGYNLPKRWVSSVGISDLKVYGSLKNYFTFSNIENYDPEQNGSISNPLMKQFVLGLNLSF